MLKGYKLIAGIGLLVFFFEKLILSQVDNEVGK